MKLFSSSLAGLFTGLLTLGTIGIQAQVNPDHCGTMPFLELAFKKDPSLKARLSQQETQLQQQITGRHIQPDGISAGDTLLIPVVFHIVLTDPSIVPDAQILAQLDTLNKNYAGLNSDSAKIPSYFKPLFGHSTIRFALAKRTPDDQSTTGITRTITTQSSFSINDDAVKSASTGGADAWNTNNYLNIWLCPLSGGILGYSTLPAMTYMVQGVVVEYRSLPGGGYTAYNQGKTLTHEIGHFFNMYHIWGDDNGACTGTDYVEDTPNQANYSYGTPSGVVTDACTAGSPGIMYQNYMDYTDDDAMEMFTLDQVVRMQAAANTFRASLLTSNGAMAAVIPNYDAALKTINTPDSRLCSTDFAPAVTIANNGVHTLTSLTISTQVDADPRVTINWRGSVATNDSFNLSLPTLSISPGKHVLTIYTSVPDGVTDEKPASDTLRMDLVYNNAVAIPLSESFEGSVYPPPGWDLLNEDGALTWEKVGGVGNTGSHAVVIRNFDDGNTGARDYLRLPQLTINKVDSGFMTFSVAAGMVSAVSPVFFEDTLEVLVSTDCGVRYTSLYKKWGTFLSTTERSFSGAFTPLSGEWRKDSVDLTPYIGQGPVMVAFRNTNGHVNNIYLDDINVYGKVINPNLKHRGFLVTPNPTTGPVNIDFYPNPSQLKGMAVYSVSGSLVAQIAVNGAGGNHYLVDLGRMAAGIYIIKVVFRDRVKRRN